MQNVIVDTNVLVRALIRPDSSDGRLVRLGFDGKIRLWYSELLLAELIRVLSYPRLVKYQVTKESVEVFLASIMTHGNFISSRSTDLCRDLDDNEVLGIALALAEDGTAYLVSSDKDLLVLEGKVNDVRIQTPQEFLKKYRPGS